MTTGYMSIRSYQDMDFKHLFSIIIITFILNDYYIAGQNSTNLNVTSSVIEYQIKPPKNTSRSLFLLFLACLLTTLLIIAMIITYNRVTGQYNRQTNFRSRFQNFLHSLGLNNLGNHGRFNFFSISNNHHSSGGGGGGSGHHRQGESSRIHLNENQDEALLFDDPYADSGISTGIHGSSANPYKSLTLSVT